MAHPEVREALERALKEMGVEEPDVHLERPRDPTHGDLATNVAMTLASSLRRPPRQIAEEIAGRIPADTPGITAVEIAGPGFLNFRLSADTVAGGVDRILAADHAFGRSDEGGGEPVAVEFVSANPTGLLHLGHGRQAALGDAISSLLEWTGWAVHREFYYNDAGRQIDRLAESVRARYRQHFGREHPVPEDGYHGSAVIEVARAFAEEEGDRWLDDPQDEGLERMRRFAVERLRQEQDRDLSRFRVHFDEYFLESGLYSSGRVDDTVEALRGTGLVYEKDEAVWLRTSELGDQKDRVMIKSDGSPTYFLPDVAYHLTKWERGFRHAINVQGSDHHGTVARVRAGLRALGLPEGYPEYVLHQMVTVEQGGEEVKFSKRAGDYLTLRDLVEEVGVDVTRYFFLMRKPEAHLVFDLDWARDQSDKNPVYKAQYAHARMCSILRKAGEEGAGGPGGVAGAEGDAGGLAAAGGGEGSAAGQRSGAAPASTGDVSAETRAPDVSAETRAPDVSAETRAPDVSAETRAPDVSAETRGTAEPGPVPAEPASARATPAPELSLLSQPSERELIQQLGELPALVRRAAAARAPHLICDYLEQTAGQVNAWYHAGNPTRNPDLAVLHADPATRAARLQLTRAVRIVLRNALSLLGLEAPERMQRLQEEDTDER